MNLPVFFLVKGQACFNLGKKRGPMKTTVLKKITEGTK